MGWVGMSLIGMNIWVGSDGIGLVSLDWMILGYSTLTSCDVL